MRIRLTTRCLGIAGFLALSVCHAVAEPQFFFRAKPGLIEATAKDNGSVAIALNDFSFGPYYVGKAIAPTSLASIVTITGGSEVSSNDLKWNVTGLPEGLVVINGILSGTPTQEGHASITVTASHQAATSPASRTYHISIYAQVACHDPSNIGKVGTDPECDGMLIVDRSMLNNAVVNGYQIEHNGTIFTLADSQHKVFTGQVSDFSGLFANTDFNGNIGYWDTANATNMRDMFNGAILFNQPISGWDTSNVKSMIYMFNNASSFNQHIGNWNVSNVTNINYMFAGATSFNQPIDGWDTSNVLSMVYVFSGASSFNQPIGNWNTSKVTSMMGMFYKASSFNQSIARWNTSNVQNMNYMFNDAISFNQPLNNWNVTNVTRMRSLFYNATSFNQPIASWNTSKVTDMSHMFHSAITFTQSISGWDVSNVTDMRYMFENATVFNDDLSCWNVERITVKPDSFDFEAISWDDARKPLWGQAPSC